MAEFHIRLRVNAESFTEALQRRWEGEVISVYEESPESFTKKEDKSMGYGRQ